MATKEDFVRAEIARRGLTVVRHGCGYRIWGRDIDVLVARIDLLGDRDLHPAHSFSHFQHPPLTEKKA